MSTSASSLRPIHLLRALLREASYLPDATARTYFRRHIVNRFKAYQPKENATGAAALPIQAVAKYQHKSFRRRKIAIIQERARPLLRRAQKSLNFLRRANLGELPCLQKVLYFAYGRMGKRKYVLLRHLLQLDPNMDPDVPSKPQTHDLAPLQQLYYSNKRYLQYFDAPKVASNKTHFVINISPRYSRLRAVVRSQYEKSATVNREIKSINLITPIKNAWERPMPIRRARNNVRRWYAETLTRLLPPLPAEEWDNIRSMAAGEKHFSFKQRRTRASSSETSLGNDDVWLQYIVSQGITLDKPSRADKPAGRQRPHNLNTRFMRRLYAKLFALCCKLEYDDQKKTWKAVWGEPSKLVKARLDTTPIDDLLFAGVDAKGCIPQAHQDEPSGSKKSQNLKREHVNFPFYADYLPTNHPIRKEQDAWKMKRGQQYHDPS